MQTEQMIADVVEQVIRQLNPAPHDGSSAGMRTGAVPADALPTRPGVFAEVDPAVAAAKRAQQQLIAAGIKVRAQIVNWIKQTAIDKAQEWGRIEFDETRIGRLDHKVLKLELFHLLPGVEFLETVAQSGDDGLTVDEFAPWGVIGAITPVTHSIPTLTANVVSMIAAGNAVVFNPHPSGAKCAAMAVEHYNREIKQRWNIDSLINTIEPPTLRSAEEIFKHPDVHLLVATGGPGVARAAMKQPKRAIVAGPGNPPVVVDETADFDNAATSIIQGAIFDNNLLCIGEKEVFVVDSVFDQMMAAMRRAGAFALDAGQIDRLVKVAIPWQDDHYAVNKDYIGADPQVLGQVAGAAVPAGVELLYGETDESNPFVAEEQMMPFVPFVRCRDFDHGLELALKYEHGFGHTSCIHSNNLDHITRMGQAMNTTLYIVNGPSTGALGAGGEGYASYSIATPTGEGVTNPLTFTRFRRMAVSGSLRII